MNIIDKVKNGIPAIGSWVNSASPILAELMAQSGFDFLTIDVEHSAIDLPQTQCLFQAINSGNPNCSSFVRLPDTNYSSTKRYLDAGANGVIAPLVNTPEQASELVEGVKYPPLGNRGVGFCRANNYGIRLEEAFNKSNSETLVCIQIEHIKGVNNIREILDIDGIDVVFIGPYDLTASMGITGQFEHPEYLDARREVLSICKEKNIIAGIHVVKPDANEVKERIKDGFLLVGYSLDITIITDNCYNFINNINGYIRNPLG